MPALTPSVLANLARCFDSCIAPGGQLAVTNYLLSQILLEVNAVADVSPRNLANQARCFQSCIPPGEQLAVANYLLGQIALGTLTPGTGTPQVFQGAGDPVGLQPGQSALLPAIYTNTTTGDMFTWDTGTGTWI